MLPFHKNELQFSFVCFKQKARTSPVLKIISKKKRILMQLCFLPSGISVIITKTFAGAFGGPVLSMRSVNSEYGQLVGEHGFQQQQKCLRKDYGLLLLLLLPFASFSPPVSLPWRSRGGVRGLLRLPF